MSDDNLSKNLRPRGANRPKIWAEGGQKPRFDLRAFASASVLLSRDALAPLLSGAATAAARFAVKVAGGSMSIPETRLGRVGRYLPSHVRVANWITASARLLDEAGDVVTPRIATQSAATMVVTAPQGPAPRTGVAPVVPVRPRSRLSAEASVPAPQPLSDPVVLAEPDLAVAAPEPDATVDAVRNVLTETGDRDPATRQTRRTGDPGPLALALTAAVARLLGWGLTILVLPYGAVLAVLAHLNGEDLREMTARR